MRILVTGAAGFIGQRIVERLLASGHEIVGLVRTPRGVLAAPPAGMTVLRGDIGDAALLGRAAAGCDAVLHLANASGVADERVVEAVNVGGTEKLLAAARAAGVKRFVFISSISANRARVGPYGRTKRLAEQRVRESGLPFVILRPSLVYGVSGVGLFATLSAYLKGLPVVPVIGDGKIELDPVHLDDVCAVIEQCLSRDDVLGRAYDVLGPDRVTFDEFLARLSVELGVKKPFVHLPGWLAMLMARGFGPISKRPPISVDNVLGMISPATVDREGARRDFRIEWTTLAAGFDALLNPTPPPPARVPDPGRFPVVPMLEGPFGPSRAVRVAVVGLGKMGVAHTAVLSMIPGVRLVGLCDRLPALGKSLRGMGFDAPFYASLESLLAEARPDAVWVCTPPDSHWEVTRRCVEAGAAVFVEKPLAHTVADATRLAGLAERGAKLACGFTLAYWPHFTAVRRVMEQGVLGEVTRASSSMVLSQVFSPQKGWMYDPARSGGGVVANISSHLLFLLRWYFGEPVAARGTARRIHGVVEDEMHGAFTLANGAEVSFESSWSVPGYPLSDVTLEIEGGNGRLCAGNDGFELELREARGGWAAGRTRVRQSELAQPAQFDLNGEAYWLEDAHFLGWVTGGEAPPLGAAAGLEVQRMMAALYASDAAGGARVELTREPALAEAAR